MIYLVMILTTVLLFISLEFAEGKSYNKPVSILLLLIFEIFHTTVSSVSYWDETSLWDVLDFNPKSESVFPVSDQAAAAFRASSVSSPKPTSHPQQPAPNNQQCKAKKVPDENLLLKKPRQNHKALRYHPSKTGAGVTNFFNPFSYKKIKIFYSLQLLQKLNIEKLSYSSDVI